ncbi:MAG TPA: hypothetical protein PK668_18435 [Myxococcota bacterium]|nr:hypothetical protein [Myxococcota bacterium]HRY95943.1 hypothetical protein [Myxococcota bacterium]HSA23907.1 hypothetical protein [Myxococcota bacterium]
MPAPAMQRVGLALAVLLASGAVGAEPFRLSACPEVAVLLEDPVDPHGEVGPKLAEIACQKLADLAPRFGLALDGQEMVQILIADDPRAFHERTGRTLSTGAVYSSRHGIVTQATKIVRRMWKQRLLPGMLAHELTHYLVFQVSRGHCPTWLNEGLAEHFGGERVRAAPPPDEASLQAIELRWRAQGNIPDPALYLASHAAVAKVLQAAGEQPLLQALPGLVGLRDPLALRVGDRALRAWLFGGDDPGVEPAEPAPPPEPPADGVTRLPLDEMLKKAKQKPGGERP